MPAPFAALEARTNAAALKRLANVEVTFAGAAEPVSGIFDNAYALGEVGGAQMASTSPIVAVATSNVPANPVGTLLAINALNYRITQDQPDGTGWTLLELEVA
ncbi:MAG: hypothetical protein V4718_00740 [Pseudomonadota bacterium]